jgi:ubiquinone/menaquinone biosynthesis C-methylase UbiE
MWYWFSVSDADNQLNNLNLTSIGSEMDENDGFYTFLGKIDAFDGQYIGGVEGMRKLMNGLDIKRDPNYNALEVGAATGFTSCYVAKEYGCHLTSTDISGELVEKARRRAARLGLTNMDFRVADAMNLDFPEESFDAVYGIATTGVLPDKPKALSEYLRVAKPGGSVGSLDLFIKDDASPEVEVMVNTTMSKVIGSGAQVMRLDAWRKLVEDSGLINVTVDASFEDVFEEPGFRLGTYLKLAYYLVVNSWFRSLFFEVMDLRKTISETSDDIFDNIGYVIYTGRKPS